MALAAALAVLSGCGGAEPSSPVGGPGDATAAATILATGSLPAPAPGGASWRPRPVRDAAGTRIATVRDSDLLLHTTSGDKDFLPGVNLGSTTPGHAPGELSITAADYRRWFPLMARMGLRVVRIYTIHPPAFYRELAAYNRAHADAPLFLMQGVYLPDETYNEPGRTLYSRPVTNAFAAELRDASAAVHGDLRRAPRRGRASGSWTTDVSPWLAAWIVGIELDPQGVRSTDRAERGAPAHRGRFFTSADGATPTERWLAARMDELASAERRRGAGAPIAFVNWPTTDPLRHPDEPLDSEDLAGVDANHVRATAAWPAGTFASYHAYPYYPDFLRHEKALRRTRVDGRPDPYAGYLAALRRHHADLPVMITEFGVPSSIGSAHTGTRGRDQGAHTEQDAMRTDAALLRIIRDQGLAGGLVFAWTDEWFKFTWNTRPRQDPEERRPLWHDALTNEQWFGLLADDPRGSEDGAERAVALRGGSPGSVEDLRVAHDEGYAYLRLRLGAQARRAPLRLAFDVVPGGAAVPGVTGAPVSDFSVAVDPVAGTARMSVRAALDATRLDARWGPGERPAAVDGWTSLRLTTNRSVTVPSTGRRLPPEFVDVGVLRRGRWEPAAPGYRSDATWDLRDDELHLRLPWAMLGLADPSSRRGLTIDARGGASTVAVPRIGVDLVAGGRHVPTAGFTWEPWQRTFHQLRVKAGISAFVDAVRDVTP